MVRTTRLNVRSLLLAVVVAILLVSGCSTTVTVSHLVPAEVNMSAYRNLAIASTSPFSFSLFNRPASIVPDLTGNSGYRIYSGYGPYTEREIAQFATRKLYANLASADYFTILPPAQTDSIIGRSIGPTTYNQLIRSGADAVILSDISYMDIEEYIYAAEVKKIVDKDPVTGVLLPKPEERMVLTYFLKQRIAVTFRYEVVDLKTGRPVVSKNFNDQWERVTELPEDRSKITTASDIQTRFENLLDDFLRTVKNQLAPRWERSVISLMSNKPEVKRAETAYEAAKQGNYTIAKDLFLKEWDRSKHIPSGYNAALMTEALGDLRGAMDLMSAVYRVSGSSKVNYQLIRMQRAYENQRLAESQM
jgi:hypothetical protein